jgi:predicted ArsR family transcriptional regulator
VDLPLAIDPDDVLAQPTRARLFAHLGELRRPAGTAELAAHFDLHPNGVRMHLERMEQAGLVERARVRQARGRPRDAWTIAPDARPGGSAPQAYGDLGRWLVRLVPTDTRRLEQVEETGREIGQELAPERGDDQPAPTLQATLVALGFQPHREPAGAGEVTYCLGNCPYRDAVRANREVVCTLHRGITQGLLDKLAPGAELAGFVPRDPDEAGCLIELRGSGA